MQAIIEPAEGAWHAEPEQLVDRCLDLLGPVEVGADTKKELTDQAKQWGQISWDNDASTQNADAACRRNAAADRGNAENINSAET